MRISDWSSDVCSSDLRVLEVSGKKNPTPRDFIEVTGRGLMRNAWVGTGKEVADQMEQWFTEHACDGFVVGATHVPGGYEDFVRFGVPELQRRGIFRKAYRELGRASCRKGVGRNV